MIYTLIKKMTNAVSYISELLLFLISNAVVFVLAVPMLLVGIGLVSATLLICSTVYSIIEWSKRSNQKDIEVEDRSPIEFTPTRHIGLVNYMEQSTQIKNRKEALRFESEPTSEWQSLRQIEQ